MSEDERKNGEYEKPESKGMGGDDLEDVSGGTQPGNCYSGTSAAGYCGAGQGVVDADCTRGGSPTVSPDVQCKGGMAG